jgi:hypothetical protein
LGKIAPRTIFRPILPYQIALWAMRRQLQHRRLLSMQPLKLKVAPLHPVVPFAYHFDRTSARADTGKMQCFQASMRTKLARFASATIRSKRLISRENLHKKLGRATVRDTTRKNACYSELCGWRTMRLPRLPGIVLMFFRLM